MPTRSLFCAWQISMVAALSQMMHIMTPVLNVRSADMVCEVVAAGRLRCAFMVLGHVVMVILPFSAGSAGRRLDMQARPLPPGRM